MIICQIGLSISLLSVLGYYADPTLYDEAALTIFIYAPLYFCILSSFAWYIYFLPGLLDPELKLGPLAFLILNYLVVTLLTVLFCNICGLSSALLPFYFSPLTFALFVHFIYVLLYDRAFLKVAELMLMLLIGISFIVNPDSASLTYDNEAMTLIQVRFGIFLVLWAIMYSQEILLAVRGQNKKPELLEEYFNS